MLTFFTLYVASTNSNFSALKKKDADSDPQHWMARQCNEIFVARWCAAYGKAKVTLRSAVNQKIGLSRRGARTQPKKKKICSFFSKKMTCAKEIIFYNRAELRIRWIFPTSN